MLEELSNETVITHLESIFMPYVAERKKHNQKLAHYTSAENALKILTTKKLWMRHPSCMNDYNEILHGHDMVGEFFKNKKYWAIFSESLDKYEPGIAPKILEGFLTLLEQIRSDIFITSLSEHELSKSEESYGRLSMWRAYGGQHSKVALIFNASLTSNKATNVILSPALYFTQEELNSELLKISKFISQKIDYLKTLNRGSVFGFMVISLLSLVLSLKHPAFEEEKEWRLIYLPSQISSPLIEKSVETINGTPQTIYKFPLENENTEGLANSRLSEKIYKIMIGPTQYPLVIRNALTEALSKNIENPEALIKTTEIPLRI